MALKMGSDHATIKSNMDEMMKAGHPQKHAMATAMAMAQKSKKMMADGGMVDDDDSRSLGEIQDLAAFDGEEVENPEKEAAQIMLAATLQKKASESMYSMGGLVEAETSDDMAVGNKPSEDMMDSTEEPLSAEPMKPSSEMLTAAAKSALEEKKKKRRFQ